MLGLPAAMGGAVGGGCCGCFGGGSPAATRSAEAAAASAAAANADAGSDSDDNDVSPARDCVLLQTRPDLHAMCAALERAMLEGTNPGAAFPGGDVEDDDRDARAGCTGADLAAAREAVRPGRVLSGPATTLVTAAEVLRRTAEADSAAERADASGVPEMTFADLMSGKSPDTQTPSSRRPEAPPRPLWAPVPHPQRSHGQEAAADAFAAWFGLDPVAPYACRAEALASRLPHALAAVARGDAGPDTAVPLVVEAGAAVELATALLFAEAVDDEGTCYAPAPVRAAVVRALLVAEEAAHGFVRSILQWAVLLGAAKGAAELPYEMLVLWRKVQRSRNELIGMGVMVAGAGREYRDRGEGEASPGRGDGGGTRKGSGAGSPAGRGSDTPASGVLTPSRPADAPRHGTEALPGLGDLVDAVHASADAHWQAASELRSGPSVASSRSGVAGVRAAGLFASALSRLQAALRLSAAAAGPLGQAMANWSLNVAVEEEAEEAEHEEGLEDVVGMGPPLSRAATPASSHPAHWADEGSALPSAGSSANSEAGREPGGRLAVPPRGVDSLWGQTLVARRLVTAAMVDVQVLLHSVPPLAAGASPEVFGIKREEASGRAIVDVGAVAVGVFGVFVRLLGLFRHAGADVSSLLQSQVAEAAAAVDGRLAPSAAAAGLPESAPGSPTASSRRSAGTGQSDEQVHEALLRMQRLFSPYVGEWISARRRVVEEDTLFRAQRETIRTGLAMVAPDAGLMHTVGAALLFRFCKFTIVELTALPALLGEDDVSRAGLYLLAWPIAALARRCTAASLLALSSDAHGKARSASHRSTAWLTARRDARWLMDDALRTEAHRAPSRTRGAASAGLLADRSKLEAAHDIATAAASELRAQDARGRLAPARQRALALLEAAPWPTRPHQWHAHIAAFFALEPPAGTSREEAEEVFRRVLALLNDAMYCHKAVTQVLDALGTLRVAQPLHGLGRVDMRIDDGGSVASATSAADEPAPAAAAASGPHDTGRGGTGETGAARTMLEQQALVIAGVDAAVAAGPSASVPSSPGVRSPAPRATAGAAAGSGPKARGSVSAPAAAAAPAAPSAGSAAAITSMAAAAAYTAIEQDGAAGGSAGSPSAAHQRAVTAPSVDVWEEVPASRRLAAPAPESPQAASAGPASGRAGSLTIRTRQALPSEVLAARVRVAVLRASNVPWMDNGGTSRSDPYACVTVAPSRSDLADKDTASTRFTRVVENSADPEWRERFVVVTPTSDDPWVRISVHDWDGDETLPDDFIGAVSVPLAALRGRGPHRFVAWLRPKAEDPAAFGSADVFTPSDAAAPDPAAAKRRADKVTGPSASRLEALTRPGAKRPYEDPASGARLPSDASRAKALASCRARLSFVVSVDTVPVAEASTYRIGTGLRAAVLQMGRLLMRGVGSLLVTGLMEVKPSVPLDAAAAEAAPRCSDPVIAYLDDRIRTIAGASYPQLLPRLAEEVASGIAALAIALLLPGLDRLPPNLVPHAALAHELAGSRERRSWLGSLVGAKAATLWLSPPQVVVLSHTVLSVLRYLSEDDDPLPRQRVLDLAEPVPAVLAWWAASPDFLSARGATLMMRAIAANTPSEAPTIGAEGAIVAPTGPRGRPSIASAAEAKAGAKPKPAAAGLSGSSTSGGAAASARAADEAEAEELDTWMREGLLGDDAATATAPAAKPGPKDEETAAGEAVDGFMVRGIGLRAVHEMLRYRVECLKHAGAKRTLETVKQSRKAAVEMVARALREQAGGGAAKR